MMVNELLRSEEEWRDIPPSTSVSIYVWTLPASARVPVWPLLDKLRPRFKHDAKWVHRDVP